MNILNFKHIARTGNCEYSITYDKVDLIVKVNENIYFSTEVGGEDDEYIKIPKIDIEPEEFFLQTANEKPSKIIFSKNIKDKIEQLLYEWCYKHLV